MLTKEYLEALLNTDFQPVNLENQESDSGETTTWRSLDFHVAAGRL